MSSIHPRLRPALLRAFVCVGVRCEDPADVRVPGKPRPTGTTAASQDGFIGTREAVTARKPSRATSRGRDPQVTQRERANNNDAGYGRARLLFCPGWRSTRRDDRLPSLPVAQRSLNWPAPSCPQVAVVPKARPAIAPRTRTIRVRGAFQLRPVEEGPARLTQYRRVSLSGLVLCLPCQPSRFARPLGHLNLAFFRPFRLPLVTPLREHHQLLLSSRNLRPRLLALMSKDVEVFASRGQLGLDLSQISSRHLLLVPLGQQLILTGFQLG